MKKMIVAALAALALLLSTTAVAGAHSVNSPGTCQFLGGPGNLNHPGHAQGHTVALAAEQSDAVAIGGCL